MTVSKLWTVHWVCVGWAADCPAASSNGERRGWEVTLQRFD